MPGGITQEHGPRFEVGHERVELVLQGFRVVGEAVALGAPRHLHAYESQTHESRQRLADRVSRTRLCDVERSRQIRPVQSLVRWVFDGLTLVHHPTADGHGVGRHELVRILSHRVQP